MKASPLEPTPSTQQPDLVKVQQLTELLIKHYGITSGFYELGVHFGMGNGNFKNPKGELVPGVFFGLDALSLVPAVPESPGAVDASKCNPAGKKKPKTKLTKSTKKATAGE